MKPAVFLLGFACAALLAGLWGLRDWTFAKASIGGDYLLMGPKQSKECEEGGGCAIFSTRELNAALVMLMQRQRGKDGGI
jgi:hypothetical protein